MSYIQLPNNTTFCPDTPKNRREFEALKKSLSAAGNTKLQRQISKENAWLRSLRSFRPGYEPDR